MVANDGGRGSVEVCMHIQVVLPQVALHQQLILLRVAAAHDQVVLARHKPVELLKPGRLAQLLHRRHCFHLHNSMASRSRYSHHSKFQIECKVQCNNL